MSVSNSSKQNLLLHENLSNYSNWTSDEWKHNFPLLTIEQLREVIPFLPSEDIELQAKLLTLIFTKFNSTKDLELLGHRVNEDHFLALCQLAIESKARHLEKLSFLLSGVSTHVFKNILLKASSSDLVILRELAVIEPLQHQLTLFSHALAADMDIFFAVLERMQAELSNFELDRITAEQIAIVKSSIERIFGSGFQLLSAINQALALAWNTNRLDLISSFSHYKELLHKTLIQNFGDSTQTSSAGLWASFEKRLNHVFEFSNEGRWDHLRDEEPALEALIQFSIWHLSDYREIGLLPASSTEQRMDSNAKQNEYLFSLVKENMNVLGLSTVEDLKKELIYSKQALIAYIAKHRERLKSTPST